MIRLKDVAERAGVSLMTVSKVLHDAPDVSQRTKLRIRRLVEEMGYVPDTLARSLRTRHTRLFGLVLPSILDPLLSPVVVELQHRVQELGYDLLLAQSQDNAEREERLIRRLLSRRVDGLFISPVYRLDPEAPVYQEILRARVPTVLLGQPAPFCAGLPSVGTDDAQASYAACRHLIELGHRRIAFFAGPPAAAWARERFQGYSQALREAALPVDDRLVFSAGMTVEDGQRATAQLLGEGTMATAIQTVSDLAALGVASALERRGLSIPRDFSLIGFGNHLAGEFSRVPLTTVAPVNQAIGAAAILGMQRLLGGESLEARRFPAQIILRASTSPPPVEGVDGAPQNEVMTRTASDEMP